MDLAREETAEGGLVVTADIERRMRAAFDGTHMPQGLANRTLARIEEERAAQQGATPEAPEAAGRSDLGGQAPQSAQDPLAASHPETTSGAPDTLVQPTEASRRSRRRSALAHRRLRRAGILAACLLAAAIGIAGITWAWQPYAYVAIDVNPSIELGINRFDRVAVTRAYNEDGEQVLEQADVQGDTYEQAMEAIEAALREYLDESSAIELTIVCNDREAASQLETVGTRCLDEAGTGRVHCSHASEEDHHAAGDAGMGVGKYRVYQELVDAGVDIDPEEAQGMTMRELLDLASQNDVSISWHADETNHEATGHHQEGSAQGDGRTASHGHHRSDR